MAIMTCQAADRLASVEVDFVVTDTTATFTVVDPCHKVRDCKFLKAVLTSAYCEWVSNLATPADPAVTPAVASADGACCCKLIPWGDFDLVIVHEDKEGVFTGGFTGVDTADATGTVTVSPPFTYNV